ncbi:MAG: putative spermidine/putrescine transport system ATP-binding protein [Thermomicrobiales bacterium]|nr:putative spermidine/putrescine transport system ATP-binding protein [Thermomicrobiales bacterium]
MASIPDRKLVAPRGASVRLDDVVKQFDAFTAVDHVSLEIEAGEFLTLLGPSGSGKTTLLAMIAGFETPTSGAIAIGGTRVDRLSPDKRNVGMVFQNYALFPHMTVAQNVAFPLRMRGWKGREIEPKVRAALGLVQLEDQAAKLPTQLSGGQQQRVALARALVYEPPVWLMDEPLGALDRRLREIVKIELVDLHRTIATTIVYVTHDQDEALTMSDRIAVMRSGKIVQVGTPRQIYEHPTDAFVAEFVGESTMLPGRVARVEAGRCDVTLEGGAVVAAQSPHDLAHDVEVRLLVRPEKIRLRSANGNVAGILGAVTDTIYLGDSTRYRVEIPGGHAVLVRSYNRADLPTYRPGDRVGVEWDAADAMVLR